MLERIDHIVVFVSDMEKSVNFYTKILNLPLRNQSAHWSEVGGQNNSVYIGLHETPKDRLVNDLMMDTPDITFSVTDIEKVQETLIARGVNFRRKLYEIAPNVWLASFYDVDKNKISIYEKIGD